MNESYVVRMEDVCTPRGSENSSGSEKKRTAFAALTQAPPLERNVKKKSKDIVRERQKNGLVFGADGRLGVVQAAHYNAPQRHFGNAPTVSATPQQHANQEYVPLEYLCCNSVSCNKKLHKHDMYKELHDGLRPLSAYTGTDENYEKQLGVEYALSEEHRALDADVFASQPAYIKDFMNIFVSYFKIHDDVFARCARNLAEINYSETQICKRLAADIEALREASATLSTSRQAVRAQFTEARDIVFRKVDKAIEFNAARMAQRGLIREETREVTQMLLFRAWKDFLVHRDESKLLAETLQIMKSK